MALIECHACKRSISAETTTCIHCGAEKVERQSEAVKGTGISFGSLPRNKAVPEAVMSGSAAPVAAEPVAPPKVVPASAGRRRQQQARQAAQARLNPDGSRPVEGWLKIMVFLMPLVFVWFLLRQGHSLKQRFFGFGWLALLILWVAVSPEPPPA